MVLCEVRSIHLLQGLLIFRCASTKLMLRLWTASAAIAWISLQCFETEFSAFACSAIMHRSHSRWALDACNDLKSWVMLCVLLIGAC